MPKILPTPKKAYFKRFTPLLKALAISEKGFTLFEIVISVAILLVIAFLALSAFSTFQNQITLNLSSQGILSTLRLARSNTTGSKAATTYGVHFDSGQYVLFSGNSYSAGDPNNKIYTLNGATLTWSLTGGGNEVIFNLVQGDTDQDGSVTVTLTSNSTKTSVIKIDSSGQVSANSTLAPTGTEVVDARHLHFDLTWSIQGAQSLNFSSTDGTVNPSSVSMTGFFSGSTFKWANQTISIGGVNQVLSIHSHGTIDVNPSTLSIHRDGALDTKNLTISITPSGGGAAKAIVTYPGSTCVPSTTALSPGNSSRCATVGAWGGTMTSE